MDSDENGQETAIIREIYNGKDAHENFEIELERALEASCKTIIIEPSKLGEDTAHWIGIGNCLHKTAVLAGFGSLVSGFIWPDRPYVYCPFGAVSLFCTGLYTISWQFDPCCKYQVENGPKELEKLPLHTLNSTSPVVLVLRDDNRRKLLHWTATLTAVSYCGWRLYQIYV